MTAMRFSWIVLAGLLTAATGCSKKEAASTPAAAEPGAARPAKAKAASADDGAYDPSVAATVPTTQPGSSAKAARGEAGTGAKNWDAVVAEIVQLRSVQRTEAQTVRLNQLQDEIVGAINTDPTAREAYQNLSRIINKR